MATHSSIFAWRIPWIEEPGGLQSMGSHRVRHAWVTNTLTARVTGMRWYPTVALVGMSSISWSFVSVQNLHLFLNHQMVLLFICKTSLYILDQMDGFQIIFSQAIGRPFIFSFAAQGLLFWCNPIYQFLLLGSYLESNCSNQHQEAISFPIS